MQQYKVSIFSGNLRKVESVDEYRKRAEEEINKIALEGYEIISTCSDGINIFIFWKK